MDQPKRVLVVEDDAHIADLICLHLRDEQFDVVHSADGNEGLRLLEQGGWDALILDLMLPGVDGLEICRRARAMARYTPIIKNVGVGFSVFGPPRSYGVTFIRSF